MSTPDAPPTDAQAPEVEAEATQEICRFFSRRGRCRYGDRCHFQHIPRIVTPGEGSPPEDLPTQEICRAFSTRGRCRYGDNCHFQHIPSIVTPGVQAEQDGETRPSRPKKRRKPRYKKKPAAEREGEASAAPAAREASTSQQPDGSSEPQTEPGPPIETPLDTFFAEFEGFSYDRTKSASSEWSRLIRFMEWRPQERHREFVDAQDRYKASISSQFNRIYGTDVNDLTAWQNLCRVIDIAPIPDDLDTCRRKVARSYINLVDLVDLPNTGGPLIRFRNEHQLSRYTLYRGKIFPRDEAHAGGVLKYLLRHIKSPGRGHYRPRRPAPATQDS